MSVSAMTKVGDWVRFHAGGELRTGVVEYVRQADRWPWKWEVITDAGTVEDDAILERRARTERTEGGK